MELLRFQESIASHGWAVTDHVVELPLIAELRDCISARAQTGRGGARNLLDEPRVAALAASPSPRRFAGAVLGEACFAVRALGPEAIAELRRQCRESICLAVEGALLAFRPLLLHASSPAARPAHRRVIHIEYAARPLAMPLAWHRRVA